MTIQQYLVISLSTVTPITGNKLTLTISSHTYPCYAMNDIDMYMGVDLHTESRPVPMYKLWH